MAVRVRGRGVGARPPAARRADRLAARGRRHAVRRRPADRQLLRAPRAALRPRHRRAARRGAARLGVGGGRAAARDPPAPGALPGQGPLLDGLVLPGPRRRPDRSGGRGADSPGLGPVRRARSRRALCRAQPVGDRRRVQRTGARPVGGGRVRPGAGDPEVHPAPAGPGVRPVLDRLRLRGRRRLAAGTDHLDGGFPAARGRRAGRTRGHLRGVRRRPPPVRPGPGLLPLTAAAGRGRVPPSGVTARAE
ncbi:hypothetical protein SGPA1_30943 [Streptomyces misionensis JCM 4497]